MMSTVDGYRTQGRKQVLERGGVNLLGLHACGRGGGPALVPMLKSLPPKQGCQSTKAKFPEIFWGP